MKQICKNILLFICAMSTISSFAQIQHGFTISGHIDGLKDGYVIKLGNRFADWHIAAWMDSCVVINGNFLLRGNDVPNGPRYYDIAVFETYKHVLHVEASPTSSFDIQTIFVQNGDHITIEGSVNNFNQIKISGGAAIASYHWALAIASYANAIRSQIEHHLDKIRDSIGYDYSAVQEQVKAKKILMRRVDSLTRNVSTDNWQAVPLLLDGLNDLLYGYHGYFTKDLYDRMPSAMKDSYYGKKVKNSTLLAIGQRMPDFTLPAIDDGKITLNDYEGKGKITLVHFWGTNSFDVEKNQRDLKLMYKKYKSKGLNIIGVSADTSVKDWKERIELESYPWPNVIAEPKGWMEGSLIYDVYNEGGHSIPNTTNVLLDDKGTILAWDVSGIELQYYLEKYLGSNSNLNIKK